MVRNIYSLRHIFKINLRIAFHKSYAVNLDLEHHSEARFLIVPGDFFLIDL